MGTEAPRWWRQLLDQLQVAAAEASAAAATAAAAAAADGNTAGKGWQPSNLQAIVDTIDNIGDLPDKLPKAVWKKVLALQVPHKLVSACCQQPDSVQLMAQPFALAVRCLMWAGSQLCADTTTSISLAESFLQQLQQSDLLQHLAAAMSHTTHHIWELQSQAGSDVLTAELADSAYNHKQDWGPSCSSLQQLHLHAGQLCGCVKHLQGQVESINQRTDSTRWHELLLPVAVPALELSVLTVQHVSTCLELLPARAILPPKSLWQALLNACDTTKQYAVWCSAKCSCCAGLRQQMLQSPYHLPATCIALLVAAYRTLISRESDAWINSATSTTSSSQQQLQQVQMLRPRWAKAAWELACSRHDALPASHYLLLQLTGCSSKATLWAATGHSTNANTDILTATALNLRDAHDHLSARIRQDFSSPELVPETSAAFLRHAVLLHWGWHYWQESQGGFSLPRMSCVRNAWAAGLRSLNALIQCRSLCQNEMELAQLQQQQLHEQQQQVQQQQPQPQEQPEQQEQQQQSSRQVLTEQPSALFFPVPVYLQVLDDVLLLVYRLLTLLLSAAAAQQQPAQAASSSSSSISANARNRNTPNQQQQQQQDQSSELAHCLEILIETYTALSSSHMTGYAGMQPMPYEEYADMICCLEAPVLREDAAVWFQHAGQICIVLEACVREAARSQTDQSAGSYQLFPAGALEVSAAAVQLINPTEVGLRGPLLQAAAAAASPGSKEQQQLHGLLRSMLKWAGVMGSEQRVLAEQLRAAVAVAAANMLLTASRAQKAAVAASTASAESVAEGDSASSSAVAGGSSHHQGGSTEQPAQHSTPAVAPPASKESVMPHLPWLGVLGCCCLQWSQQLASLPTDNAAAAAAAAQSGLPHCVRGVLVALPQGLRNVWGTAVQDVWSGGPLISLFVETVCGWLSSKDNFLVLVNQSCGDVGAITKASQGCLGACKAVRDSIQQHPDAPVPLAGYAQQLSALGEALCSVAHKQSCNNPTCSNLSGPSELQLVKGRSNTCSGCRTARYCSPECMRQHWKQHRPVCKVMGRTAAGAAAEAAAGSGSA